MKNTVNLSSGKRPLPASHRALHLRGRLRPVGSSRRAFRRVRAAGHAELFTWSGRSKAQVQDLSETGLFLRSNETLPEGKYLTLRLSLPTGQNFTVLGRVVRQVHGDQHLGPQVRGLGLRFVDLSHRDRRAIGAYIASREATEATLAKAAAEGGA